MSASKHLQVSERLSALFLQKADDLMDRKYGAWKRVFWSGLPSEVVEIGAGAGANMRYYKPGTRVIAIEPNVAMHRHLEAAAQRHSIQLKIMGIKGESMDLPNDSVDAVIGTLVLCSVADPSRVLAEVHRILRPGGRYIFLEHVAADSASHLRRVQEWLRRVWHWLFDGCHLNRNTQASIYQTGFSSVAMDCFMLKPSLVPFAPHICGLAMK